MRRMSVFSAMAMVVLLTSAGGSLATSSGCDVFNSAEIDGQYIARDVGVALERGETISFTAARPVSGSDPIGIALKVGPFGTAPEDLIEVDSDGFPGTVSYTVPADGGYRVLWTTQSGAPAPVDATWDASCTIPVEEANHRGSTMLTEPTGAWIAFDTNGDSTGDLWILNDGWPSPSAGSDITISITDPRSETTRVTSVGCVDGATAGVFGGTHGLTVKVDYCFQAFGEDQRSIWWFYDRNGDGDTADANEMALRVEGAG